MLEHSFVCSLVNVIVSFLLLWLDLAILDLLICHMSLYFCDSHTLGTPLPYGSPKVFP